MSQLNFRTLALAWLLITPASAKDADQARADLEQGLAAYRRGDLPNALKSFDMAIQEDSSLRAAYAAHAMANHALGNYSTIDQDLKVALPMIANDALTWTLRGTALALEGSRERAIQDFDRAIESDPHNAGAFAARANAYKTAGNMEKATEDWLSALHLDPKLWMAYYDRAEAEHRIKEDERALRDLTKALRGNPRFSLAYSLLGEILVQRRDFMRAQAAYSKAINANAQFAKPYLGRAAARLELKDKEGALSDYAEAIRISPASYSPYYDRGKILWQSQDKEAALADFVKAAGLDVPDVPAALEMASLLQAGGKTDEALSLYSKALDLLQKTNDKTQNALLHDALLARARLLYRARHDNDMAEKDLNLAVSLFPNSAAVWTERGKFYLQTNQQKKASADLDHAISIDPKFLQARMASGRLKAAMGRAEEARKDLDAVIEQEPRSADAIGARAVMNLRLGDDEKALDDLNQAIALAPNDPQWHIHLASIETRRRQFRKAVDSLTEAIKLAPPSAQVLAQRAQAYSMLGDLDSALKDMRSAMDLDPKSGQLYLTLSGIHLRARQLDDALDDLEQAEKLEGESYTLRFNKGATYGMAGEYGKSAREFKQAVNLGPTSAQAQMALCRALRLEGKYSAAEHACSEARNLDPKNPAVLIDHGLALFYLRDFENAASELVEGYHLGARYAGAELARSVAHAALDQYAESDAAFRSAMELDPWNRDPQLGFAPKTSSDKTYDGWIRSLEKSIGQNSDEPLALLVLGNAQASKGDYEQAVSEYTKAMQKDGTLAAAYLDRCAAYEAQSHMDLAEEDCRHAVELAPSNTSARVLLLKSAALNGDYDQGLKYAADAIRTHPKSAEIFFRAGNLRYFLKDMTKAKENYALALQADPEYPEAHNGIGLCELAQGNVPEAIEDFSRAIAMDPRNARYYADRAAAYVHLASFANAAADYQNALAANANPDADASYKRLRDLSAARAKPQVPQSTGRTK